MRKAIALGAAVLGAATPIVAFQAHSAQPAPAATISVPSVTVPGVTAPSVTVPSVTVPSVTAPSVTVPSATTPSVSTPSATTPSVSTPSATSPSVSTPSVSTPSVGTSGSSGASTAGSGTSGATTSGSGTTATRSAGSAGGSSGTSGIRARAARVGSRSARIRRHNRELRALVLRLRGCMGKLPRAERRVLILRAGIGIGHVRTRRQVARLTHLRRGTVARLERRGLRQLRALGRSGGCAAGSTSSPLAVGMAVAGGRPSSGAAARTPDSAGVLAEHRSGGPANQKPNATTRSSSLVSPLAPQASGGGGGLGDFRDPLLVAAAVVLAIALLAELRHERAGR
jgi:Sigma-70, region 4